MTKAGQPRNREKTGFNREKQGGSGTNWHMNQCGAALTTSGRFASRRFVLFQLSGRVVEDDAERGARAAAHPAHPVAEVDAVGSARALHGPFANGEDHAVALA